MTATLTKIGATALVGFEDIDPTTRAEVTASVTKFHTDFPKVADSLREVRMDANFPGGPTTYAFTHREYDSPSSPVSIGLNPAVYGLGTRAKLENFAQTDFMVKWHPYWQAAGVLEHELCHVIDFALEGQLGTAPSWKIDYWDAHTVSDYGVQAGPFEVLADAFAAWRLGEPVGNSRVRKVLAYTVAKAGGHYA